MQMPWQTATEERDGLTWAELLVVVVVLVVTLAIAVPILLNR
jgi:Tfp pilus assembly protein FimT